MSGIFYAPLKGAFSFPRLTSNFSAALKYLTEVHLLMFIFFYFKILKVGLCNTKLPANRYWSRLFKMERCKERYMSLYVTLLLYLEDRCIGFFNEILFLELLIVLMVKSIII